MDDFKPWRRKIGVVTLAMACVFMAGWVRSLTKSDYLHELPFFGQSYEAGSHAGAFHLIRMKSCEPPIAAAQGIVQSPPPTLFSKLGFAGVEIQRNQAGMTVSAGKGTAIPYWSIVLPLTALSAYLLLSKPRSAKDAAPPVTTVN